VRACMRVRTSSSGDVESTATVRAAEPAASGAHHAGAQRSAMRSYSGRYTPTCVARAALCLLTAASAAVHCESARFASTSLVQRSWAHMQQPSFTHRSCVSRGTPGVSQTLYALCGNAPLRHTQRAASSKLERQRGHPGAKGRAPGNTSLCNCSDMQSTACCPASLQPESLQQRRPGLTERDPGCDLTNSACAKPSKQAGNAPWARPLAGPRLCHATAPRRPPGARFSETRRRWTHRWSSAGPPRTAAEHRRRCGTPARTPQSQTSWRPQESHCVRLPCVRLPCGYVAAARAACAASCICLNAVKLNPQARVLKKWPNQGAKHRQRKG